MSRSFEVVTFDCYGTLVDWEGGIRAAFEDLAERYEADLDIARAVELHAEIEPVVQAERFRSYREVLDETAARIARRLGFVIPTGREDFLSASLQSWPPFSDSGEALRRLIRAGLRLGILSNVDDDLLAATRRRLGVEFEFLVTAEQVGSYKPSLGHFVEALRRIGQRPWLHVAQSLFHDIVPARELGVPVVWINRKKESSRPDLALAELPDLTRFADWLLPAPGGS